MTPNINGDLHIVIDLESELNDQIYYSDTVSIQCLTNITEIKNKKKVVASYNLLGKRINTKKNTLILNRLNNGEIIKQIIID